VPGVPLNNVQNSQLNPLVLGVYTQFALDMRTGFVEGGFTYVPQIVSMGPRLAKGHLGCSAVIESHVNLLIATVRRRRVGRGV